MTLRLIDILLIALFAITLVSSLSSSNSFGVENYEDLEDLDANIRQGVHHSLYNKRADPRSYKWPTKTPQALVDAINKTFVQAEFLRRSFADAVFVKKITNTSIIIMYDVGDVEYMPTQDPCQLANNSYWNWIFSDDGQISFGQYVDVFEWNARHWALAQGRKVVSAGEGWAHPNGSIIWNLNSGSYSLPAASDSYYSNFSVVQALLTEQVWQSTACASRFIPFYGNSTTPLFPRDTVPDVFPLLQEYCPRLGNNIIFWKNGTIACLPPTSVAPKPVALEFPTGVFLTASAILMIFGTMGSIYSNALHLKDFWQTSVAVFIAHWFGFVFISFLNFAFVCLSWSYPRTLSWTGDRDVARIIVFSLQFILVQLFFAYDTIRVQFTRFVRMLPSVIYSPVSAIYILSFLFVSVLAMIEADNETSENWSVFGLLGFSFSRFLFALAIDSLTEQLYSTTSLLENAPKPGFIRATIQLLSFFFLNYIVLELLWIYISVTFTDPTISPPMYSQEKDLMFGLLIMYGCLAYFAVKKTTNPLEFILVAVTDRERQAADGSTTTTQPQRGEYQSLRIDSASNNTAQQPPATPFPTQKNQYGAL